MPRFSAWAALLLAGCAQPLTEQKPEPPSAPPPATLGALPATFVDDPSCAGCLAATITLGKPEGHHGPVRRRPISELVFGERWGESPAWAVDPPGTRHTAAGPPRPAVE